MQGNAPPALMAITEGAPQPEKAVPGAVPVAPQGMRERKVGRYIVKYTLRSGNAVFQIFCEEGPFPASIKGRLDNAFAQWPGPHRGIEIDWNQEFYSFSVIVRGAAATPPGEEAIHAVIDLINS